MPDGSRVNAIVPPLAIDGRALTNGKFPKDKLPPEQLVRYASISPESAEILKATGRCRVNVLISGGIDSGNTTLLNCLTRYDERIVGCEDAAELQLQQPHVVRLETRPPNLEGEGQITMRDLVRNCLRMRHECIIVGAVLDLILGERLYPDQGLCVCGEVYSVGSACPLSRRIAPQIEMSNQLVCRWRAEHIASIFNTSRLARCSVPKRSAGLFLGAKP